MHLAQKVGRTKRRRWVTQCMRLCGLNARTAHTPDRYSTLLNQKRLNFRTMKRTNILAISVLLLMTLFISSCENEQLEPSQTEQSTFSSQFVKRSQNAVEKINEFYRQNSDSEFEARSGEESFEELWGQPNYNKLITLKTSSDKNLTIAPLEDLNTDVTHNLLVGWQQSDSIALRIVHDDRTLTDLTFDNTAIIRSVSNLFDVFNSGGDISTTALSSHVCFEVVGVGEYSLILQATDECEDDDNSGGGGVPDPNADTAPSTGGSGNDDTNPNIPNNSNETTDPDCFGGCADCFEQPDDPACAGCIITADLNCDGTVDSYETCVQSIDCILASQLYLNTFLEENFVNFDDAITWLIQNDPDLAALSYEMENAPPWMYPIIRELAVELVVELIKKRFGLQLSDELTAALNAIQQGDLAAFMIEAIDIISEVHPATKGLKALWDASVMGKKAIQIWNKIDGMATSLGDAAMEKIWNAFNSRNRNILKDFDVSDFPFGIRLNNSTIDDVWDDLVASFNVTPSVSADGNVEFFQIGSVTIKLALFNNSGPSIIFEKNGVEKYKIRF